MQNIMDFPNVHAHKNKDMEDNDGTSGTPDTLLGRPPLSPPRKPCESPGAGLTPSVQSSISATSRPPSLQTTTSPPRPAGKMDSCKRTRYNSSSSCLSNASAVRRSTEAILKWENDVVDKSRQFAMGLDVGGSLAKVAHFEPDVLSDRMRSQSMDETNQRVLLYMKSHRDPPPSCSEDSTSEDSRSTSTDGNVNISSNSIHLDVLRGTLHFLTFQSCKFEEHVDLVLSQKLVHKGRDLYVIHFIYNFFAIHFIQDSVPNGFWI